MTFQQRDHRAFRRAHDQLDQPERASRVAGAESDERDVGMLVGRELADGGEAAMTDVEIAIGEEVPRGDAEIVRHGAAEFFELLHEPASQARLTVRVKSNHARQPFVADASVLVGARTIAAHATGRTAIEAADAARDRLRRQLGRIAAQNDGRPGLAELEPLPPEGVNRPEVALKPPAKRRIVHRRTYLDLPLGTRDAVSDLLDIDAEFMLFVHRKSEDVNIELLGNELAITGEIKERERKGIVRARPVASDSSTTASPCQATSTPRRSTPSSATAC